MTTNLDKPTGKGMVLTARDRRIVTDVADFQVLTREQLLRLGHFASKTRANEVLARLVRFGYLARRHQPAVAGSQRALYYLGRNGLSLLTRPSQDTDAARRHIRRLSDLFLAHQLLVTDVRVALSSSPESQLLRWLSDVDLRPLDLGVIPDGYVEYLHDRKQFAAFVEIDRGTEPLARWSQKVHTYLLLARSDRYQRTLGGQFFRVLVITDTDERLTHLRHASARLTDRIFWFTTFDRLRDSGPWTSIWRRPVDAACHSLSEGSTS